MWAVQNAETVVIIQWPLRKGKHRLLSSPNILHGPFTPEHYDVKYSRYYVHFKYEETNSDGKAT